MVGRVVVDNFNSAHQSREKKRKAALRGGGIVSKKEGKGKEKVTGSRGFFG